MKSIKRVTTLLLCFGLCVSMVSCKPSGNYTPPNLGGNSGTQTEQIDTERTQLYVYNFYGGYGSDWLASLKERFEEEHKDDVWEEGKKGVQIYINNNKSQIMSFYSQIPDNRDEIFY